MANGALYMHHPLGDRYVQPAPPSKEAMQARGLLVGDVAASNKLYYFFYAGDFDAAA